MIKFKQNLKFCHLAQKLQNILTVTSKSLLFSDKNFIKKYIKTTYGNMLYKMSYIAKSYNSYKVKVISENNGK